MVPRQWAATLLITLIRATKGCHASLDVPCATEGSAEELSVPQSRDSNSSANTELHCSDLGAIEPTYDPLILLTRSRFAFVHVARCAQW